MHLSVHTKDSHKAVPFSVARLKMDLAFHNHPAYNRVHRERPAPLTPPFFSSTARKGGYLALKQCLWEVPALAPDLLLVEVRGVAIAVLQHRKQRRQSLACRSRNSRPQVEVQGIWDGSPCTSAAAPVFGSGSARKDKCLSPSPYTGTRPSPSATPCLLCRRFHL